MERVGRLGAWTVAFLTCTSLGAAARAQTPAPSPSPSPSASPAPSPSPAPPAKPPAATTATPAFKLPLKELNLSVEVRHRYEYWSNFDFNDAVNDRDDVIGQRVRFGLEAVASDSVKGFLQLQDARAWGNASVYPLNGLPVTTPGTGNNTLASQGASTDLHQAYFWAGHKGSGLSLQAGRQEWNYANQKVIGAVGWSNTGRAFDGVRARLDKPKVLADLLWSRISEGGRATPTPHIDRVDADFYGLYATVKASKAYPFDVYWLTLSDDEPTAGEAGRTGRTRFHTAGFQLSKIRPTGGGALEFGTELNYQFGKRSGMDHAAYALHGRLGYGSAKWPLQAKLLYQFDLATGDENRADGESGTFQQLFPTVHLWHGYADLVARQNVVGHWISLHTVPAKDWRASLHLHVLKAEQGTDALYRANGAVIRVPAAGKSGGTDFGKEVDLIVDRKVNANLAVQLGLCRFQSGTYLARVPPAGSSASTGPSDDVTFGYLQTTVSF
jgi:hypothetical protein